jgi:hypothetical protein
MYGMDMDDPRIGLKIWRGMQRSDMLGTMWSDGVDPLALESTRYWLANKALKDESMPDAEKLKNLIGYAFYHSRKEIVQRMIDNQHVNPNTIVYQDKQTPLYESVLFDDISFTKYLLEKGVNPDKKALKIMKHYPEFMVLLKREK